MHRFFRRRGKKALKDFKVVGWLRKYSKNERWPYVMKFASGDTFYMAKDFEELIGAFKSWKLDWANICASLGGNKGFYRIGRALISSTGKSVTFSIKGMDYYASLKYARNLARDKAEFVCVSKKVAS